MCDRRRWRWSMLDLRRGLLRRRLGRSGTNNPGLRCRRMMKLWRWRFDFLLLRLGLLSRWLRSRGVDDRGLRHWSVLDLWR